MSLANLIDTNINDRYHIVNELGGGGMGTVYKGRDLNLDRVVAIKVMKPQGSRQESYQQRFRQEARTLARLEHPGIVKVHDYGQYQDILYIVMQFIPGDNLQKLLQTYRNDGTWLNLSQTLQLMRQICEAVEYAHQEKILHRDIKPANIMIKQTSSHDQGSLQPVVTDLGLAKWAEGGLKTQIGISMGTPAYVSPEQVQAQATDARSDIYSLGVLLYELTVGNSPFQFQNLEEARDYYASNPPPFPPSPRLENANLPEQVEGVILKALKLNPSERFSSAASLAGALKDLERQVPGNITPSMATNGVRDFRTMVQNSIIHQPPDPPSSQSSVPLARLDHLVVIGPDKSREVVEVKKSILIIGRGEESDLVLPVAKVSREHAWIEFDGQEYRVTDRNSTNKTFLNQAYLLPGIPVTWQPGQWLYIGGYWLLLRKGSDQNKESIPPPPPPKPLVTQLEPTQVKITPGNPVTLTLTIFNHQAEGDRFSLSLSGNVPPECSPTFPTQVAIAASSSHKLQLNLHPPRTTQAQAGSYQMQVRVVSQRDSTIEATVNCQVTIAPFSAFISEVQPERLRPKQAATVTIHNEGNTTETFTLKWKDRGDDLLFDAPRRQLSLKPGEKGQLKFTVTPQHTRPVGDEARHKFVTEVSREGGESQSHQGVLLSRGVIPAWLPKVVTVLLSLVVLGLMGWWLSAPRISGVTVEPSQVAGGESASIKINSFSLPGSLITMNGTPAPAGELAYQIAPGVTGEQAINIELADFLGREATSNAVIRIMTPSPPPTSITPPGVTVTSPIPTEPLPSTDPAPQPPTSPPTDPAAQPPVPLTVEPTEPLTKAPSITVTVPGTTDPNKKAAENKPPLSAIASPANGATFEGGSTIPIIANASDPDGSVSKVEFFVDGEANPIGVATTSPYSIEWSNPTPGKHTIIAKVTDNMGGEQVSTPMEIIVNEKPNSLPTVSIAAPLGGTAFKVGQPIQIQADAKDLDGNITGVEFFANGTLIGSSTSKPYHYDLTNLPVGSHTLTVKATDNAGQSVISNQVVIAVNPLTILFQDDFSSNTKGWDEGVWSDLENKVINGVLVKDSKKPSSLVNWSTVPGFSIQDFFLTVDATVVDTPNLNDTAITIVFRVADKRHQVLFSNAGASANVWIGSWQNIIPNTPTSAYILDIGRTNNFGVSARGNRIILYANGKEIISATDDSVVVPGGVGIGIKGTAKVNFDNLVIKEVP